MLLALLQLLAIIGFVCLVVTWWTGNDVLAMMLGLIGTGCWLLAAYGLFNVEVVSGGSTVTKSYPALAIFAAGLGVITFLPALIEPFELIGEAADDRDPIERM